MNVFCSKEIKNKEVIKTTINVLNWENWFAENKTKKRIKIPNNCNCNKLFESFLRKKSSNFLKVKNVRTPNPISQNLVGRRK